MNQTQPTHRSFPEAFEDPIAARLGLLLVAGGQRTRRTVAGCERVRGSDPRALGLPAAVIREVDETVRSVVPGLLQRVRDAGWRWVTPEDPEYPAGLTHTADPPLGLFVKGRMRCRPAAALVGSRRATTYGLQTATTLGEVIAGAGGIVISGMARGIDTAAHTGALAAGGHTWAVWASGPDTVYPPENKRLAESIAENGALITEYPPGTPPRRHHFLERNRLIAGLSQVVVVVEAAVRSGALNTARHAVDENRDVMAVPGSIYSELSVGPNGLIRAGAGPVTTPSDVLEMLGLRFDDTTREADPLATVLEAGETLSIDDLTRRLEQPVAEVVALVMELEMNGSLERSPDGNYRRRTVCPARCEGHRR